MIFRPDYIKAIEPFIDKPLVKILAAAAENQQYLRCLKPN